MPILIQRKKIDEQVIDEIQKLRISIVENLLSFMSFCYIKRTGSKHSIMGPAGKLINLMNTTKIPDWEKAKGLIVNNVRINQMWVEPGAINALENATENFKAVRNLLEEMEWLNFVSGVDHELFFQLFKTGVDRAAERIQRAFQDYLKKEFTESLEEMNDKLQTSFISWDEVELDSVDSDDPEVRTIIDEFWKSYKKSKNKSAEN
ncbi:MAG: hypothetical protein ACFFD4_40575 [Candidatus Odinarchaeota archaeon]